LVLAFHGGELLLGDKAQNSGIVEWLPAARNMRTDAVNNDPGGVWLWRTWTECGSETLFPQRKTELIMARGLLLWLLGVPLSVIILIALFTNFI
jgi:hypothetical protein